MAQHSLASALALVGGQSAAAILLAASAQMYKQILGSWIVTSGRDTSSDVGNLISGLCWN